VQYESKLVQCEHAPGQLLIIDRTIQLFRQVLVVS